MHHKEIHISDRKSKSKGKPHWEKTLDTKKEKKAVSKTAQDCGQKNSCFGSIFIYQRSQTQMNFIAVAI